MKIGMLVHVYHLETDEWEYMVWGDPAHDELGTLTKFAECLLDTPAADDVVSVVYSGPSGRNGLTEGAYTKQYLVDRIDKLAEFPRLQAKLRALSPADYDCFVRRIHDMVLGPVIKNTAAELEHAAELFAREQTDRVIEIAAATHAPRCLRNLVSARYYGLVGKGQQWYVVPSDTNYAGVVPDDVVIAEPIHRKDNPLYGFHPSWAEITKRYPHLSLDNKKMVLRQLDKLMSEALAAQPESTEVAN